MKRLPAEDLEHIYQNTQDIWESFRGKSIFELNWQPKMNAQQAVTMTIDWYSFFSDNPKMIIEFTAKQIDHFFKL